MTRQSPYSLQSNIRQRGFALVVAILLLLILTVFSLFATNVGVFEQRTSANEYRAKAVAQVADAALNHGAESLRTLDATIGPRTGDPVNNPAWPTPRWQLCDGADTTFPCGAETDPARRALTYRYIAGVDLNGDGAVSVYEQRSINFPTIVGEPTRTLIDSVASSDPANPFPVEYQVGLLLCRVDVTTVAAGAPGCTTALANTSENRAYTLVARAQMIGEQASATFTKTVVPIQDIALNPKVPSIVASGVMRGLGNATVVPNPNAGGFGIPISFWSREDFDGNNGSWQTCHYDDWLRSNTTTIFQSVPVCNQNQLCGCPKDVQLSCGGPNCDAPSNENVDLLDVDGNNGTLLDSKEFPCDLMEFLWGPVAKARDRDTDGDGWCDTANELITDPADPQVGQSKRAVSFLRNNGFQEVKSCADVPTMLNANSSGKYWVSAVGCAFPRGDIGSPNNPVQVVFDGAIDLSSGMRLFGLAFGRDPTAVQTAVPGGDARFAPGGGKAEVYGALVVEGGGKTNATILVVYDARTLQSGDQDFNPNVASVPGSWSDRVSY